MGLLDQLAGGLMKQFTSSESGQNNLLESITGLINNPQTGGISGLVNTFKEKGLGDVVSSWVSTGQNLPISADQIKNALGSEQIQQIASKLGVSSEDASHGLAQFLPQVIDKLTPNGSVPNNDMLVQGMSLLKNKLFGS
jgi:uncharacterized protein YidB (DUF937 family)